MDRIDRSFLIVGYVLLAVGIGNYVYLALVGTGSVLVSFLCLMACLFFFNWPTVRARRRARDQAPPDRVGNHDHPG